MKSGKGIVVSRNPLVGLADLVDTLVWVACVSDRQVGMQGLEGDR
jgi:hypothetical protein